MGEERILRLLARGPKTVWELLAEWDGTIGEFVETVDRLRRAGKVEPEGERLRACVEGPPSLDVRVCSACGGRGIQWEGRGELLRRFQELTRDRPPTVTEYFQGNVDAETALAKVAVIDAREGLAGKRVVVVGDDDYVSLALALTGLPEKIWVLEIDERIVDFIGRVASAEGFPIEVVRYDVREPLPTQLRQQADVFVSEPLETVSGFLAFVARGAGALREGGTGYVGLTSLECGRRKWRMIQQRILDMGFVITEILPRFSHYPMEYPEDAPYVEQVVRAFGFPVAEERGGPIWYFAHYLRLQAVEPLRPKPAPEAATEIEVYDEDDWTYPSHSGK